MNQYCALTALLSLALCGMVTGCKPSGCCQEKGTASDGATGSRTKLSIHWQRLVDDQGQTCDRCGTTEKAVDEAARQLTAALAPLGLDVELKKTVIDPTAFARNPTESNRIWIGAEPLEQLLGAQVGTSKCCGSCGDNECRTLILDGRTHEAVSTRLIVQAGLIAASRQLGKADCCSGRESSSCCSGASTHIPNGAEKLPCCTPAAKEAK